MVSSESSPLHMEELTKLQQQVVSLELHNSQLQLSHESTANVKDNKINQLQDELENVEEKMKSVTADLDNTNILMNELQGNLDKKVCEKCPKQVKEHKFI